MDYLFQFEPRSVSPNPMSDALADLQASIEEQYMALGGMLLIYPNFVSPFPTSFLQLLTRLCFCPIV